MHQRDVVDELLQHLGLETINPIHGRAIGLIARAAHSWSARFGPRLRRIAKWIASRVSSSPVSAGRSTSEAFSSFGLVRFQEGLP